MIKVIYNKEKPQFPIQISFGDGIHSFTKKGACELQRELSRAIHKMIEAE